MLAEATTCFFLLQSGVDCYNAFQSYKSMLINSQTRLYIDVITVRAACSRSKDMNNCNPKFMTLSILAVKWRHTKHVDLPETREVLKRKMPICLAMIALKVGV